MPDEERLFRREAARLVAILTRLFGIHNLALAEDVVQDAFQRALETWKFHGVPENPSAWLMATAKRRALDVLRREGTARRFAPELGRELESEWTLAPAVEEAFRSGLNDTQLRLMFSCMHPRLPEEAQVALVLNLLCGFGIDETAAAFLKSRAAMEKRIVRAKKALAGSKRLFDLPAGDVAARLPAVLRALYLLFNEGYHGASAQAPVRAELCEEALRLVQLLVEHRLTAVPAAHALAALLNLHAARLPGRLDAEGNLLLLVDQDRSRWDTARIAEGQRQLEMSAAGDQLTVYHLEAAIAALHVQAPSAAGTDWAGIVALYDTLMRAQPSPVVALNRAVAIAQRDGPARGLEEISRIAERGRLARYPFLHIAVGELALRLGRTGEAQRSFGEALGLARNPAERRFVSQRLEASGARPRSG
ncbi:MAG: RNA polymerase sigma factor [Burkholderiales bacterium]